MGADDGVHRGSVHQRDGVGQGRLPLGRYAGRGRGFGCADCRVWPVALVVSVGHGNVVGAVHHWRLFVTQPCRLWLCIGRLHHRDHCTASGLGPAGGVRSCDCAVHRDQPWDYLCVRGEYRFVAPSRRAGAIGSRASGLVGRA